MPTSLHLPSITESRLRLFFGLLLWAVSATLTLVLLVSLGDGTAFDKVFLGIVAIALEGAKILSWRKGGAYHVYAAGLIILSGIASLGASLQVVEKSKGSTLSLTSQYQNSSSSHLAIKGELNSIDAEISTLTSRIQVLPADYTTATTKLVSDLIELRNRKQALITSLSAEDAIGASHGNGTMIALLSRTLGLRPDFLLLVLLLFVSAAIEVGALLLTVQGQEPSRIEEGLRHPPIHAAMVGRASATGPTLPVVSSKTPISPEAFLEAAKEGAHLPYLHGRDKTAEKLGIGSAEAKRLVGKLIEEGRVVVEGKRLRLVGIEGPVLHGSQES